MNRTIFGILLTVLALSAPLSASASVYLASPNLNALSTGLVGYWSMDGSTINWRADTIQDLSGQGNVGTLVNMSTTSSQVAGKIGGALKFNGTSQYITVPYAASLAPTSAISFSAWFYNTNVAQNSRILSKTESGGYNMAFNDGSLTGLTATVHTSGGYFYVNDAALTNNTWYHAVATYDGSTLRLYVNGIDVSDKAVTGGAITYADSNPLCIGYEPGASSCNGSGASPGYFPGKIDDVRVYNRALSAQEVALLYAVGSVTITAQPSSSSGSLSGSLTASWNFNSSTVSGDSVADQSGNGHTLTLENGASITPGYEGDALTLDGTDQYAYGLIGSLPTSVALSMWVKANDISTEQAILTEEGDGAPTSGYHFTLVGIYNNAFYAGFWDIGDIASSPITAGQWYHVILTYDGVADTQSLYVNGILQGTQSGVWDPPSDIYFQPGYAQQGCSFTSASGHCGDLANYFNGQIDDLQAYDQAFTSSDVQELSSNNPTINIAHSNTTALTNGLVGYWTFDGPAINWRADTVADSSGNGNTGTLVNMSTTSSPVAGKIGQALNFNDMNSYVSIASFPALSNYTISFWAKPSACGTISEMQFFDSSSDNVGVSCKTGGVLANWAGGSSYPVSGSGVVVNGTWMYITVTSQGGANELYVNGKVVATGTAGNSLTSGTAYIGQVNGGGRYYGGIIDDFRVYNRALSTQEIQQLYQMGR